MLTVQELLERARTQRGGISWYRLARDLGASDNSVLRWRKGEGLPSDDAALRLANMAALPPGKVLAAIHAQREPEGSPLRDAWSSLCIMSTRARRSVSPRFSLAS
jgi:hypothetical protein